MASLRPKLPYVETTPFAVPAVVVEYQHALVVKLAVLVRRDAHLPPNIDVGAGGLSHLRPTLRADVWENPGAQDHVLDLRVRPRRRAVVAMFPCYVDRAHEVQVGRSHHGS